MSFCPLAARFGISGAFYKKNSEKDNSR